MKEKLNRQKKERLDKLNNYKKNLKEDEVNLNKSLYAQKRKTLPL
jgi:hypothetical protein